MSSITQTVQHTPKGLYTKDEHYSKVIDNIHKKITLTARGKKELSYHFDGNWTYVQADLDEDEWWLEYICDWNLDLYKPIRVEERLIISGCPGLGKIPYKQKFWIKKVLCCEQSQGWEYDEDDDGNVIQTSITDKSIFDCYAISYDKSKNGIYNILNNHEGRGYSIYHDSDEKDYEKIVKNLPYAIDISKGKFK